MLTEVFILRLQAYWWLLEFLKAEWQADPSAVDKSLGSGDTHPQNFSFLIKLILKAGSGEPEPSVDYTAISPNCCCRAFLLH